MSKVQQSIPQSDFFLQLTAKLSNSQMKELNWRLTRSCYRWLLDFTYYNDRKPAFCQVAAIFAQMFN